MQRTATRVRRAKNKPSRYAFVWGANGGGVGWVGWVGGGGGREGLHRIQIVADHPHPHVCPLQGYTLPQLSDGKLMLGQLKHLIYYE